LKHKVHPVGDLLIKIPLIHRKFTLLWINTG